MKRSIIPLELINLQNDGFHLLVEVVVFGQAFNLVLDTGASKTVLDKTTIEEHIASGDLKESDQLSTGLGTNSMESFLIHLPSIRIGNFVIKDFTAAVLDLSTISTAYRQLELPPVIGVIGGDILRQYHAIINYEKLHLKLSR